MTVPKDHTTGIPIWLAIDFLRSINDNYLVASVQS